MDFLPSQSPIWFDANISDGFINWDISPLNRQVDLMGTFQIDSLIGMFSLRMVTPLNVNISI